MIKLLFPYSVKYLYYNSLCNLISQTYFYYTDHFFEYLSTERKILQFREITQHTEFLCNNFKLFYASAAG